MQFDQSVARILRRSLILLGLVVHFVWASSDSLPVVDSLPEAQSSRPLAVTVLAWPFENLLQPTINLMLQPLRPPLDYIIHENLIPRGMELITLGDEQQAMLYPTFNLLPGTGSSLGLTYRHWGLLLDNRRDYMFHIFNKFVNGDWNYRAKYSVRKVAGTEMLLWGELRYKQDRDAQFVVPEFNDKRVIYTDTSWSVKSGVNNPLNRQWTWGLSAGLERKYFGEPREAVDLLPTSGDSLGKFDRYARGFYQHFWQYPLTVQLDYNSRDYNAQPTEGQFFRMEYSLIPVSHYTDEEDVKADNGFSHNFSLISLVYQYNLRIGKKRYRLTREESRENRKYLENFSIDKTLRMLHPDQIRETFLERKVLAMQLRMRQLFENSAGNAAFTGYSELNANTPLRGYDVNYFNRNLYAASLEYRWPIVDMVDGVIFNEYALLGKNWRDPEWDNLRNSWGFGVRVSKPDLFLTRAQVGFHGTQGVNIILTINPEFL